jgi:inward rectifier potassium channel
MADEDKKNPPATLQRVLSREGRNLLEVRGLVRHPLQDLYHFLIDASWPKLLGLVLLYYVGLNTLFAGAYLLVGDGIENAKEGSFLDAFFFSVQTMATIGYGKLVPRSVAANVLVTLEALIGMLTVAMVTGLLFSKFARPTARVLWSDSCVISNFNGVPCLMFRLANERRNQIVEAEMRLSVLKAETTQEGAVIRRVHDLHLLRNRTQVFALTWTAIHPLDEKSPLHGIGQEEIVKSGMELFASLIGIDETFSQTVHARHGWAAREIRFGHRFKDLFREDGDRRIIDYGQFHLTEPSDEPASKPGAKAAQG